MLRCVIFDLDDTLYSYTDAHAAGWRAQTAFVRARFGLSEDRFEALHREAYALQKARCGPSSAIHNRLIRCQMVLEALGLSIESAPEMARAYWDAFLASARPFPDAADTLRALRRKGLRVGVGTNMTADMQFEKLKRMGLMPLVDFLVTSEEAGVEKPLPGLFRLCAEKAGCPPEACAFVGDHLSGDAQGAAAAGMRGIWLCRDPKAPPPPEGILRIDRLSRLTEAGICL